MTQTPLEPDHDRGDALPCADGSRESGELDLGVDEDFITEALCAYQAQLERGEVVRVDCTGDLSETPSMNGHSDSTSESRGLPLELDELKRCLDLVNNARLEASSFEFGSGRSRTIPDYDLPSQIGRFEIRARIAYGGFGIVFRGFDPDIRRDVAIKIPRPEFLGAPNLIKRFAYEAAAAARLEHPNIIAVYDSNSYGNIPYIVFPYVPGINLAQWRAEQNEVSPRTSAEIVRQLACGLTHAHERGVLHRDVKPGNVLLAPIENSKSTSVASPSESMPQSNTDKLPRGRFPTSGVELPFVPMLTDFGLAKCADFQLQQTLTGAIVGTRDYMSPEQVEGKIEKITARSDVYGLGAVLYELLTGAPPVRRANTHETIQNTQRHAPPSLRAWRVTIPFDLEVICLKCLEESPANRYSSAAALADDLQRFLNGEPILARPISQIARIGKWCRRHPAWAIVIVFLIFGSTGFVSVLVWYNSRLTTMLEVTERERQTARVSELALRQRAYVSDMRNAHSHYQRSHVAEAVKLLDHYRPRTGEQDVRDVAWWSLWHEYNDASKLLGTHEKWATAVAMTGTGDLAASGGTDGVIRIWSLPSGDLSAEFSGHDSATVESLDFSPDGKRLVSAGEDGTVRIWDVKSGKELFVRGEHESLVSQAVYSPGGDVIASGGGDGMIRLWNPETGEPVGMLSGHTNRVRCLAFHPSGRTLASGSLDGTVRIWDLNVQGPVRRLTDGTKWHTLEWPRGLIFDPDGVSLTIGTIDARLRRVNPQDGRQLHSLEIRSNPRGMCWPQGGSLAVGLANSEIQVFDRFGWDYPRERLIGHQDAVISIAATADGSSLISAGRDGQVRYWLHSTRSRIKIAPSNGREWNDKDTEYHLQWRDGYLAADFKQGELSVFRMPKGELERTIPKSNDDRFTISPSGKLALFLQRDGQIKCTRIADQITLWSQKFPPDQVRVIDQISNFCEVDRSERFAILAVGTEIIVIHLSDGVIIQRIGHPRDVNHVTLVEKTGKPLLVVSGCDDGVIRFWDVQEGTLLRQPIITTESTLFVAVSNDHRWLAASGQDKKIRIWNFDDLTESSVISHPGAPHIGFVPGSETVILYNEKPRVQSLLSLRHEAELMVFPDQPFGSAVISPDGNQIAIPQHGWIRLIDATPRDEPRKDRVIQSR